MSLIIILQNVSDLAPVSDYKYKVLVGDGTPDGSVIIEKGFVKEHKRDDGWRELVRKLVDRDSL